MGKLIKWLFAGLALLLLLAVGAVVLVPLLIDPNDYQGEIKAAVMKQTGRELTIAQPISLSVLPQLAMTLDGVSLGNAAGFGEEPFAQVEALILKVKILPLLSRRIEISTLVLKGATLNLARNRAGQSNWEDLTTNQQLDRDAKTGEVAETVETPFRFAINGLRIEDARLVWDDRQAGQRLEMDAIRLRAGVIAPGMTAPINGGLTLIGDHPRMRLDLGLDGALHIDQGLEHVALQGLALTLAATGEGLPQEGFELALRGDLEIDGAASTVSLTRLQLTGPRLALNGQIEVTQLDTEPVVTADLSLEAEDLKRLAAQFGGEIQTADPDALSRLSGRFGIAAKAGGLAIDPLDLRLDETDLRGYVRLASLDGPTVRAELDLDEIDLDRYLPPPAPEAGNNADPGTEPRQEKPPGASGNGDSGNPFAGLRTLDLNAKASVGKLKIANLRMSAMSVTAKASEGVLRLTPIAAKLYEGTFDGLVELDARHESPRLRFEPHLKGIEVGPLVKDLTGEASVVGTGIIDADLSMVGMSEADIRRSLAGQARFDLKDASAKLLIDAIESLRKADVALLGGRSSALQRSDFSELTGSVTIDEGLIENRDLQAKSPLLRLNGQGKINLPDNMIDYLATIELVKSAEGQGGKGAEDLAGIPIAVAISGALDDPKIKPDLKAALSAKQKASLKAKAEEKRAEIEAKVTEKVGEQIGEEVGRILGDKLEGLFGK